jgi:hypothetical protein
METSHSPNQAIGRNLANERSLIWSRLLEQQISVSQRDQSRWVINSGIRRRPTIARKTGDARSGCDRKFSIRRTLEYFLSAAVGNV